DPRSLEHGEAGVKIEKLAFGFVVDVELEEVMRQLPIMDGVPGVEPFAVENEPAAEYRFQHGMLHGGPLLEQIVLRVHTLGDLVAAALKHHSPERAEVNAHVGAVELFFNNE